VLTRNLVELDATDAFGQRGRRRWPRSICRHTSATRVDSALRLHDALDREIELADGVLAERALASPEVRRLMTIPGVGAITALSIVGVIGEVERFPTPRRLVGYLGLDPRVRQSGQRKARHGHISREGHAHARAGC